MASTAERRENGAMVVTVNEAAYAAGVSVKAVNQAIDRAQIRTVRFQRVGDAGDRETRGVAGSDLIFLRVQRVLAPEYRRKVYPLFRGKTLAQVPTRLEVEDIVLDLEQPISEVRERLRLLQRIKERVEINPELRAGEPVFRGTRTPVYGIARKLELGSSLEELREDYPQLEEGDFEVAARFAKLHPRRGRPRTGRAEAHAP